MSPAVLPLSALPIRGYDLVAMTSFEESATCLLPDAPGLWCQQRRAEISGQDPLPALFLDRDGVIVEEVKYLHRVEDVRLIAGVDKIIATCNENNIPVVLVTNQSGVGRGLYGWAEFAAVQDSITDALDPLGAHIDMVLACAYHDQAQSQYKQLNHFWRKPNPGMFLEAEKRLKIDLSRSWIVGDQPSDIEAGRAAKLCGGVLVLSGQTSQSGSTSARSSDGYRVRVAYSLAACRFLVGYMKVAKTIVDGSRKVNPVMDREAYNKLKQDEKWVRKKLGLDSR